MSHANIIRESPYSMMGKSCAHTQGLFYLESLKGTNFGVAVKEGHQISVNSSVRKAALKEGMSGSRSVAKDKNWSWFC